MRRASKNNSIALPADMFNRSRPLREIRISSKEYRELLNAAAVKNKMAEFHRWQDGAKIVITDGGYIDE